MPKRLFRRHFWFCAESGVDLAAAHAGELAPRGCVSLGSQAENGDLEAASQGETDRNAARTGGPPRTKLARDLSSARSRVVPLAGYVPGGRDLLRFAGVLADGRRAAAWLAGGDAQGALDAGPFDPRQAVDATRCGSPQEHWRWCYRKKRPPPRFRPRSCHRRRKPPVPWLQRRVYRPLQGAKTATLVKGVAKSLYVGKTAVAAAAGGVTLTAALAFVPPSQGTPPSQNATTALPAAVELALKENAQHVTPISVSCTIQMKSTLSPTATFDRLKVLGVNRSEQFFSVHQCRVVWQGNKVRSSYKSLGGLRRRQGFDIGIGNRL